MDPGDSANPTNPTNAPNPATRLRSLFSPRSIAVVGAGRTRGSIGAEILHNLLACGFSGALYPVNPNAATIEGLRAWPRVGDIPAPVDLVVVAVTSTTVESVVDDCVAARVGAIVIISAGFGETGAEGRGRELRLREKVRAAGIPLVGPNCMGLVNTDPAAPLNASFSPAFPPAGAVAFSSQSGALGLAVLECAKRMNLGLSSFVSLGNKADVSTNDLLEYWEHDPRTSVVLMYVESFGNPRRFAEIARRVGKTKPIVALKAGRSGSGARAASSHTGALAANDTIVDALFRDAGVIRTATVNEMFETAALLAHQPLPAGPRVAVLTNAGGPGILAADACEANGLTLSALAPTTRAALQEFLPREACLTNPVDMIATASAADYRRAIPLLLADPGVDSLLTIFIPPLVTSSSDVAQAIVDTTRGTGKPVLATFFGADGIPDLIAPIPCYTFPESAAGALANATRYAQWRSQPAGTKQTVTRFDGETARSILRRGANEEGWLEPLAVGALLEACGIPAAPTRLVVNASGAVAAARQLGYPVVLKGVGPTLLHKTEAGVVHVGLRDESDVLRAHHALARCPDVHGILVQPMIKSGVEMFIGGMLDPNFGHVVMCGAGGTMVELLHDVACRLTPLNDRSARDMIEETRARLLLRGFRGSPVVDEQAFADMLLRTSALLDACPDIVELDFNPVIVTTAGAFVIDARIRFRGTANTSQAAA